MAYKTGKTRKGSRRRWSSWPCTSCGTQVEIGEYYTRWQAGEISEEEFDTTRTHCPNCGSPKSAKYEGEHYQDPAQTVLITDRETYDRTDRGVNIPCEYCSGESTVVDVDGAALRSCSNCGAGMDGRDYADGPLPKPEPPPAPRREFPSWSSGQSLGLMYDDPGPVSGGSGFMGKILGCMGILLIVAFIIWLCIFLFGKHEAVAQVDSIGWEITHVVKQRKVNKDSDWKSDMHSGSYDESCTNKYKETVDCTHKTCNPDEVPGDPVPCNCQWVGTGRWEKNGDGSETEIEEKVCDMCPGLPVTVYEACHPDGDEIHEDWCEYKYDTWPEHARKTTTGSDHVPVAPTLVAVGSDQKLNTSQTLTVQWEDTRGEKGPWTVHPNSLEEFRKYNVGDKWIVDYSRAGSLWPKKLLSSNAR